MPAPTSPPDQLEPLDPAMVPFAVGGMVLWAVAGLVLLMMRSTLEAQGREEWLTICLAGLLVGIPGLITMMVHDRRRARRRAERPTRSG